MSADEVLSRPEARRYLKSKYHIETSLEQRAVKGNGPVMLRFGDNRIGYRRSALDDWAGGFVREVSSSRDTGKPLTAAEVEALALQRSAA